MCIKLFVEFLQVARRLDELSDRKFLIYLVGLAVELRTDSFKPEVGLDFSLKGQWSLQFLCLFLSLLLVCGFGLGFLGAGFLGVRLVRFVLV